MAMRPTNWTSSRENVMKPSRIIEKYGWTKGTFGNRESGFCLVGALHEAYPENLTKRWNIKERIREYLGKLAIVFNDAKKTKKEDVLKLLKVMGE